MTLIEIWYTCHPESWEYTPSDVRHLWCGDKDLYRKEANGPFCYHSATINPANAPQGCMSNVWGATKWRFIEIGATNAN